MSPERINSVGSVTMKSKDSEQRLISVIVTVYEPAARSLISSVVASFDHKKV